MCRRFPLKNVMGFFCSTLRWQVNLIIAFNYKTEWQTRVFVSDLEPWLIYLLQFQALWFRKILTNAPASLNWHRVWFIRNKDLIYVPPRVVMKLTSYKSYPNQFKKARDCHSCCDNHLTRGSLHPWPVLWLLCSQPSLHHLIRFTKLHTWSSMFSPTKHIMFKSK